MLFEAKDLEPGYTVEEIEKLFFLKKDLSDLDDESKQRLLGKLNLPGLKNIRLDTVHLLLCIMHEARELDQKRYLNEVFLPWYEIKRKTKPAFERIGVELSRIREFRPGSTEEAAHLVNIYRNIVSDLFDPYLTFVFATFQFIGGKFTTLLDADLTQSERTKHEYLTSHVNKIYKGRPTFLSGYDPRVRNAASHTGSSGVAYQADRVVFRNIKRENPPVVETVVWTFDELQLHLMQLLECIMSIETAAEIFGLDCSGAIHDDFGTYLKFLWHAAGEENRSEIRNKQDELAEKIWASEQMPDDEKHKALANILFYNYGVRDIPSASVRFSNELSAVLVEVPTKTIDLNDEAQITDRLLGLTRYAIIAGPIFDARYQTIIVEERNPADNSRQLAGKFSAKELHEYAEERAGLVDLVNDASWSLSGKPLGVEVDFKAIRSAEFASPSDPLPRKERS